MASGGKKLNIWPVSWINLIVVLVCVSNIVEAISDTTVIRQDGYCVMYGQKNTSKLNKPYNGPAKPVTQEGFDILQEICPTLNKNFLNETLTCCDIGQLKLLQDQFQLADMMLRRCPSCKRNFHMLWCEFTCSPDQSKFLSYPGDHADYYLTRKFADDLFESCENVAYLSGKAFDYMCGSVKPCTVERYLQFLGTPPSDSGAVGAPFLINFKLDDADASAKNITSLDTEMKRCNATFLEGGKRYSPCSCLDCHDSCRAPPPPAPPMQRVFVMGVELYYFIVGLCLVVWLVIFLVFSACQTLYLAKRAQRKLDIANEQKTIPHSPTTYTMDDAVLCDDIQLPTHEENYKRFSIKSEVYVQSLFRNWGTWCAENPIRVIVVCLLLVVICSVGLTKLKVVTDPVDLWTSPSSEARIQKKYFDENFTPFYRTTQIIITAREVDRPVEVFFEPNAQGDHINYYFSGVMYKDILDEVLELQKQVMDLTGNHMGKDVKLNDICLQPLSPDNKECAVFSLLQYWQLDQKKLDYCDAYGYECNLKDPDEEREDWHYQVLECSKNPAGIAKGQDIVSPDYKIPCLSKFGAPMSTELILGGYDDNKNLTNAKSLLITIPIVNHNDKDLKDKAIAWEKEVIKFLKKWEIDHKNSSKINIAYSTESSMEDEISRVVKKDYSTMAISYGLMFLYIAVALGQYKSPARILVDAKLTVGIIGVLIVVMSVTASVGIAGYVGLPATMIVFEVLPFLVLAVGVDNIFILVQELQRSRREEGETIPEQVGRVLGVIGPSMLLCSLSESVAFAFGALSGMPVVHTFAALASIAVAVNFLLQVTVLVAVLSLDAQRQANNQIDVACCFNIEKGEAAETNGIFKDGMLYYFIKHQFSRFLLLNPVRILVVMGFSIYLCCSICMIPNVNIGISQTIALPSDSYLQAYFGNMSAYLKTGAPVYFVVKDGLNYSDVGQQNKLCSTAGCSSKSLVAEVFKESNRPKTSKIALPPMSWIDDYMDWIDPSTKCCRKYANGTFCPSTDSTSNCTHCVDRRKAGMRPSRDAFREMLPWFLEDNPNENCAKSGHAAYGKAVKLNNDFRRSSGKLLVNTTHFMTYHTVLSTAGEFTEALRYARELSANISTTIGHEVFPYSIFYVFYEQYLTIRDDIWKNLLVCLLGVFIVTFLLLGFNIRSAVCVAITVCMIIVNLMGWMYLWGISFNAVSLVNLVMSVGISVEFCSHVVRAFSTSNKATRVERAEDALGRVGSSVLSGITLTKFVGTFVLMFSESKLFVIYYFRMYTGLIVVGALHGIVFLPVLLSYVGPPSWIGITKEKDVENPKKEAVVIQNFAALDAVKMSIVEANDDKFVQEMSKYDS